MGFNLMELPYELIVIGGVIWTTAVCWAVYYVSKVL